jgi:hypothetical protein
MRGTTRSLAVLGLLVAVAALSACGSDEFDGRIPQDNADALRASLAQVRDDVSNGECDSASTGAQAFVDGVNQLPETATTELKDALRSAGEQLERLVSSECAATTTTTTTTTTSDDSTTSSTESTTTTTDTSTDTGTDTGTTTSTGTGPDENGGQDEDGGGDAGGGSGDSGGDSGGTRG